MWEIIKYILFAPYCLCSQALSTPTPQENKINYESLYKETTKQITRLLDEAETEKEIRDRYLRDIEDKHAAEVLKLKSKYNIEVQEINNSHKTTLELITAEKTELINKNANIIEELQHLVTQDQKKTIEITNLEKKLQKNKKLLLQNENARQVLEDELLLKNTLLQQASEIRDRDIKSYANQRHYLPPEEADKIKEVNHQLIKNNEQLKGTLQTLKKEINYLYEEDVKISQRLISYLTDSTKIKTTITNLTVKHNAMIKELEETRHNIINTDAEINSYAQIKDDLSSKSYLDQTDLTSLTQRLRDLGYAEDRRLHLMQKLEDLSNQASIWSKKIEDQTKLYSKRNDMLIKEINEWITEKAKYYVLHDIPLRKEDTSLSSLEQYAESVKQAAANHKTSLPWNIEREKEPYTYKEFNYYLSTKKYEASHKYVPDLVRMSRERELLVVHLKTKESTDIKVNLPYQGKILHPQPTMQQNLVDDIIRKSLHNSGKFIVRKSPVNSGEKDTPIYISKMQKQITDDNTTPSALISENTQKRLAYFDHHHPDFD